MLAIHQLDIYANSRFGIEITNLALVQRIRRQAETITPHEIADCLAQAITDAADAAHVLAFAVAQFGEAGADAIIDAEYHEDLAAARSLVACEHELYDVDARFAAH